MIEASDFREVVRNTLLGFVTLTLSPSGIVLHECTFHRHPDGKEWVGLPARPQIDTDGRVRKDPITGKNLYAAVIEIKRKPERERFQTAAVAAVKALIGEGAP